METLTTVALLLVGLLHSVPKQARHAKANQNGANRSIRGAAAPEQQTTTRPCPEVKKKSTHDQPKQPGYWKLFLLALLKHWPLVVVAVWGIIVTIGSVRRLVFAYVDLA